MGIDISGGMIIGANASKVKSAVEKCDDDCMMFGVNGNYHEEFCDWYESEDMETFSFHYDAGESSQVLGFTVEDANPLSEAFDVWLNDVKNKSLRFKDLTGIDPKLIGMQNVW